MAGIIKFPLSLTGSTTQSRGTEAANAEEVVHAISRIKQHHRDGLAWWYYDIDDAHEKQDGLRLSEDTLPITDFQLLPKSPEPMPTEMTISVGSFWSLPSSVDASFLSGLFNNQNTSRFPRYKNLYTRILLELPSDLATDSAYIEQIRVYSDIFEPVVELPGDVHVKSSVADLKSVDKDGGISPGQGPVEFFGN